MKINQAGYFLLESRNIRPALFFLGHSFPTHTHVHAHAHAHTYTCTHKIPRSELLPTVPGWDIPHIKELLPEMTVIPKSASIKPLWCPLWDICRRTILRMYFSSPERVSTWLVFEILRIFLFISGQINAVYLTVVN